MPKRLTRIGLIALTMLTCLVLYSRHRALSSVLERVAPMPADLTIGTRGPLFYYSVPALAGERRLAWMVELESREIPGHVSLQFFVSVTGRIIASSSEDLDGDLAGMRRRDN